jgi:hypothetical protein
LEPVPDSWVSYYGVAVGATVGAGVSVAGSVVATFLYQPELRASDQPPPGQIGGALSLSAADNKSCRSAGSSSALIAGKPPMSLTTDSWFSSET